MENENETMKTDKWFNVSDNNLSHYIVLTSDEKEVRFFVSGYIEDNKEFTGIMHDYTGGGNYEECLLIKDKFVPTFDSSSNEPLEWDEQVNIFNQYSAISVDKIESDIDKFIEYNTENFNYVPKKEAISKFENGVLMENISLNIPFGLGNTSFIDGLCIFRIDNKSKLTNSIWIYICTFNF